MADDDDRRGSNAGIQKTNSFITMWSFNLLAVHRPNTFFFCISGTTNYWILFFFFFFFSCERLLHFLCSLHCGYIGSIDSTQGWYSSYPLWESAIFTARIHTLTLNTCFELVWTLDTTLVLFTRSVSLHRITGGVYVGTASTRQTHFSHWSVRLLQRNPHTHTHTHILTFYILHDHAEVPAGFEGAEHGDDEGILCEGEDVSFHEGLLDLVPQDQVLLIDLLHGESLAGVQMPHQVHSAGTQTHHHRYISGLTDVRMNHLHVNTSSVSGVIGSTHPYAPLLISLMVWKSASPGGFIALILPCRSKVTKVWNHQTNVAAENDSFYTWMDP